MHYTLLAFLIPDHTPRVIPLLDVKSFLLVNFDLSAIISDNITLLITIGSEWWFVALCLLISSFLFFVSSKIFLLNRTSLANQDAQKKFSTERERGKIARDMNDNLGSELFGLKLMGQVALSKSSISDKDKYLQKIVETSHHLIENVSEVIWISDFEQDNVSSLWSYLQKSALYYLKPSGISYAFDVPNKCLDDALSGEKRHDLLHFHRNFFQLITLQPSTEDLDIFFTIQGNKLMIIIGNFRSEVFETEIKRHLLKLHGNIFHQKSLKTIIEIPLEC